VAGNEKMDSCRLWPHTYTEGLASSLEIDGRTHAREREFEQMSGKEHRGRR